MKVERALDILLSGGALLALQPVLLPLMVALRFTGEGEIFYRQMRVGLGGQPFGLLKLATMIKNSPSIGTRGVTVKNDPRILPLGRFLRKSKLNELPQLWNVFVGDMSIVGPRPMVPDTFAHYPQAAQEALQDVRPGLTGVGSIIFREEERYLDGLEDPVAFYRKVIIPYKSDLEVWFLEHRSLWLYLKVIVVTAWVIFFPRSAIVKSAFRGLPAPPKELQEIDAAVSPRTR